MPSPAAPAARPAASRLLRFARLIGLILVGVYIVYLVGANVMLRTHLLRSLIDSSEDKTWVEYESAYTLWPGHVRVRNLLVRDRDATVEWALTMKTARARVRLLDLLGRRFHAVHVRARGARFKLRTRPPVDLPKSPDPRFLPAIPGFEGPPPPRAEDRPETPLLGDWRVRLEDVVASVDQIWFDNYRYDGRASASGGMWLVPKNTLEVTPSVLELSGGALSVKDAVIADRLAARVQASIDECDIRTDPNDKVLVCLSAGASASGDLGDTRFLDVLLDPPAYISLHGGSGRASVDLELDHGKGAGRLQAAARGMDATVSGRVMKGTLEGELRMSAIDLGALTADLAGTHVDIKDVVVSKAASSEPWWGRIEVLEGTMSTRRVTTVDTRLGITARNARPFYAIANAELPAWVERALAMENLKASMRFAFQKRRMDIDALDAKGKTVRIRGRFRRRGEASDGVFLVEDGPLAVGLDIVNERSDLKLLFARRWYEESGESRRASAAGAEPAADPRAGPRRPTRNTPRSP